MFIIKWGVEDRLYSHNLPFDSNDIVVLHEYDEVIFKKLIKKRLHCKPKNIIKLKKNAKYCEPFLMRYIASCYHEYELVYEPNDAKYVEFELLLDAFIAHFNNNEHSNAQYYAEKIKILNYQFLNNNIIDILLFFGNAYSVPILEKSINISTKFKTKNHNWTNELHKLADYIDSYRAKIVSKKIIASSMVTKFQIFLKNISELVSLYHSGPTKEKLFFLSALFFVMSSLHFKCGRHTLSYTLSHRSVDLFFQYLCFENSLATVQNHTARGMSIQYNTASTKLVTLHNSLQLLKNQSVVSQTAFFNVIQNFFNENRNLSYLAHGIYSVNMSEAKRALHLTKRVVTMYANVSTWMRLVDKLTFGESLEFKSFFETAKYDIESMYQII